MQFVPQVLGIFGPVVLCVLVGFIWAKLKQPFNSETLTELITNIGIPALVISHIASQHISLAEFGDITLAAFVAIACFGVVSFAVLKMFGLSLRTYISSMMFANVGNIGLPVAALAFGPDGMTYALAFWVVVLTGLVTVGIAVPQGAFSLRSVAKSPPIYAVIVGLLLLATDTPLPNAIHETLTLLGGIAIPLMLLTLGHTLANLKPSAMPVGFALAVFHLVMAVAVAWSLSEVFQFKGEIRGVFILQCLMPVALANYLFTKKYDPEHSHEVASLALFSTLLAILSLPLVLAFWVH